MIKNCIHCYLSTVSPLNLFQILTFKKIVFCIFVRFKSVYFSDASLPVWFSAVSLACYCCQCVDSVCVYCSRQVGGMGTPPPYNNTIKHIVVALGSPVVGLLSIFRQPSRPAFTNCQWAHIARLSQRVLFDSFLLSLWLIEKGIKLNLYLYVQTLKGYTFRTCVVQALDKNK